MNIVDLIVYVMGCAGITVILVSSDIIEPVRDFISSKSNFLGKLINCPMCLGFWVGLIASVGTDINPLLGASMVSLISWSVSNVVDAIFSIGFYFDTMLEDGEKDEGNDE
jgi:hypothetical protein